jgi:hypothetical protein
MRRLAVDLHSRNIVVPFLKIKGGRLHGGSGGGCRGWLLRLAAAQREKQSDAGQRQQFSGRGHGLGSVCSSTGFSTRMSFCGPGVISSSTAPA